MLIKSVCTSYGNEHFLRTLTKTPPLLVSFVIVLFWAVSIRIVKRSARNKLNQTTFLLRCRFVKYLCALVRPSGCCNTRTSCSESFLFFFFSFTLLSANFNRVIWLTKGRNKVLCHLYLLFIKCVSQWKDNVSSGNLVCSIACNHESGVTSLEHRAPYTIHMITHSCSSPVSSTLSSGPPPLRLLQRYYYFLLLSLWNHQQI